MSYVNLRGRSFGHTTNVLYSQIARGRGRGSVRGRGRGRGDDHGRGGGRSRGGGRGYNSRDRGRGYNSRGRGGGRGRVHNSHVRGAQTHHSKFVLFFSVSISIFLFDKFFFI